METIDLTKVAEVVNPSKRRLSYNKHKHLFTKVGFDVFQLNSSPVEHYWILEKDEDGKEYLVANYDINTADKEIKASVWEALSDKKAENVTLMYRGVPIQRFASSEYGFKEDDINIFKSALVNKLDRDKEFVKKLISILAEERKSALLKTFPELAS